MRLQDSGWEGLLRFPPLAEGLRLWLPCTGHPFCCFQGQHFASSCFSLSLLFNFFLVKILHLPCLPLTSLPLSTFTSLQSYLRSPYHFCFPDDANSFSMIPALSCLSFLTASLKALLPCFPSRSPKLPPFSSSCACLFPCTPLNLSISPSLPFIFLALLFGCSLGLSRLLLQ